MSMADRLNDVVPNNVFILTLSPQTMARIKGRKAQQEKDEFHGRADSRHSFNDESDFDLELLWSDLVTADAAAMVGAFCDPSKGAGMTKSWVLYYIDGLYYTVRFDQDYIRRDVRTHDMRGIPAIKIKVLGNYNP